MSKLPVRNQEDTPEPRPQNLFDRDNPNSVLNLLPDQTSARVYRLSTDRPDLFRMDEKSLKTLCKPTPTDNRLRLQFWAEYDLACMSGRRMRMDRIYAGVVTQQYFDNFFTQQVMNVAWMLCPPTNYIVMLTEMLSHGHTRLREILDEPVVDSKGKVDIRLGELMLKIVIAVENRLKGTAVQREELRSLNLHVSADSAHGTVAHLEQMESLEEIEGKLKRIRLKNNALAKKEMHTKTVEVLPAEAESQD